MELDRYVFWIGALLLWQAYATVLVLFSRRLDNEQKLRLVGITWALPLLGALYARLFLNQVNRNAAAARAGAGGKEKANRIGDG